MGTAALTMATAAAPKVQASEGKSEKLSSRSAEKVEMADVQAQRQQMFEAAVRANLPKEEVAKYVDFPEIIPVDKNGQLDTKKMQVLLYDPVNNYIDAVKKFYKDVAPTHRYTGPMTLGEGGHQSMDKEGYDKALATFIAEISGNSKETKEFLEKNYTSK